MAVRIGFDDRGHIVAGRARAVTRRWAAPVAALLLLAVVAAGSRARLFHESEPPLGLATSRLVIDATLYLFVAIAFLTMVLVAWALWPREGYEGPTPKRRSWWEQLLQMALAMILVGVFLLASANLRRALQGRDGAGGGGRSPVVLPSAGPATGAASATATFDWAAAAIAAVILVLLASVAWRATRRRGSDRGRRAALARELEEVLAGSVEDVRLDGDARRAVVRCYARMERAFAAHGRPRKSSEAPFEYVAGALAALEVPEAAAARLTELFEEARFSIHAIGEPERAAAVRALETVRDALAARAGAEGRAPRIDPARA